MVRERRRIVSRPCLRVRGLKKAFRAHGGGKVVALAGVDLEVAAGECVAVVGPSGSGKSTLARVLVRLESADAGAVELGGVDWLGLGGEALRRARPLMQLMFQDPGTSLDPRMCVRDAIAEPLEVHRKFFSEEARLHALRWMERCGLDRVLGTRLPGQLSGGQRQRVALARALALEPKLLIADEPVAALDTLVQRQVLELLVRLRQETGTSVLLISHDLAAVEQVADRVVVLHAGSVVETGAASSVLHHPSHEVTRTLVAAVPRRGSVRQSEPCHDPVEVSNGGAGDSRETSGLAET